jgi:type II secretory pathway pseudopilin PulG
MSSDVDAPVRSSSIAGQFVVSLVCIVLAMVAIPAILSMREKARQQQSMNHLRGIGLSLDNYHASHNVFPPGGVFSEDGIAYHDWTTLLVPYMDASPIYQTVDRNLPWDDVRNVDWFRSQNCGHAYLFSDPSIGLDVRPDGLVSNHYAASQFVFYRNSSVSRDHWATSSERLLVADAYDNFLPIGCPYGWRDVTSGIRTDREGFGCLRRESTHCLMGDCRVVEMAPTTDTRVLRAMAGPREEWPTPEQIERIAEFPLLDVSKIWKNEFIPGPTFNGKPAGDYRIRRTSPEGEVSESIY